MYGALADFYLYKSFVKKGYIATKSSYACLCLVPDGTGRKSLLLFRCEPLQWLYFSSFPSSSSLCFTTRSLSTRPRSMSTTSKSRFW